MSITKSQSADYKGGKFTSFKKHVGVLIKKRYPKKVEYEINQEKYQHWISSLGDELYGKLFYTVLRDLGEDMDKASNVLFKDYVWTKIENNIPEGTKLAQFISSITKSEAQIANAAGIKKARFNRVKNNESEDLYAWEVYAVANVLNLQPSRLFEYLYGDGERPVVRV